MRIGQVEVASVAKETGREILDDHVTDMAAAAAFRLVLALPALVIFFAALSSVVAHYTGVDAFAWIQQQLQAAPIPGSVKDTLQLLLDAVRRKGTPGLLSFGIVLALWAASAALDTMMKMFNRAYDLADSRSFVKRRLIAIGLTIGLSLVTITSFVLFVFGRRLGEWLAGLVGLGHTFTVVWDLARWPVIVLFSMLALAVLYWAGPSLDKSFRWISPGSVTATVLWMLATWGFSLYLHFADPGSAYGAMGTLIVLIFFLYISSVVLLVGAELNAVIDKRYDPQVIRYKATHPERQSDPEESVARALEAARREGKSPEEFGVTPETATRAIRQRSVRPAPAEAPRWSVGAVLSALAALALAGLLRGLRRGGPEGA